MDLSPLSGADIPGDSRAVIAADFDDDGDVDLFVHSIQRERHALFRNDALEPGKDAGYLKIRLRATSSQYEAIGATVIVKGPWGETAQVLSRGAGFVSSQPPELIFGLGASKQAHVDVLWPGRSERESFGMLAAGTRGLLVEGTGKTEAYAAHPLQLPDPLPPGLRIEEGDLLPRLSLANRDGERVVLDVAAISGGKTVLLSFWASYCAPCVKELPLLQQKAAEGELTVVSVSLDVAADVPTAQALLDANGVSFAAFFLPAGGEAPAGTVPIEDLVDQFTFTRFEPHGRVDGHDNIRACTSVVDYVFRCLGLEYLGRTDLAHIVPDELKSNGERAGDGSQRYLQRSGIASFPTAPVALVTSNAIPASLVPIPVSRFCYLLQHQGVTTQVFWNALIWEYLYQCVPAWG